MNGPQDIGGRHGFGPVRPDPDEPLFHAPWERRAMALTVAAGGTGQWTIDESRFAREDRDPAEYYALSYYQLWIRGLERLLRDKGLVTAAELAEGRARDPLPEGVAALPADRVRSALMRGTPYDRDPGDSTPAFAFGQRVRARNLQPRGHVRLPGYVRGAAGRITAVHGYHVFPDTSAQGDRETAHWLYNVTFAARDLFGARAGARDEVSVDLWEPYLDAL
ncbi:putative nitrile hydratase beta subunit [Pseudooceanicola batsensis HTCC2597]|uniref:Nitrile hydratase subunit beta n=1 Tax=Pseudooceanicola batsensis (strain ATCC BAA-863 / DSM 15984 / KCTC 12145 / HTCC2597) TaxID=252305 RepID=A3U2F7_PSEBH|nr:nitrile hydratase subunit beta [Pseudooceanicola batsensis]EAQ01757.1 putative nitrile hydratase beta subunit [Pseudooceanicola batsensis HTCC2597]